MMHLKYQTEVTEFKKPGRDYRMKDYHVNCVFQIWEKSDQERPTIVRQKVCGDFSMIHRHISRTSPDELERLRSHFDFTLAQIEGKVHDINVTKGSQFFIKDFTPNKTVREVMERFDFSEQRKYHIGAVSLTRSDIVEKYLELK